MARPRAGDLTARELEVMHAVWRLAEAGGSSRGELAAAAGGEAEAGGVTVAELRDELGRNGRELAHTTVATLLRILVEKGFVTQLPGDRPFRYEPARSFEEVSGTLLGDMIERVFGGSRERLLVRLVGERKLTRRERAVLEEILGETKAEPRSAASARPTRRRGDRA